MRGELVISKQTGQWGTEYDPSKDLGRVKMAMKTPLPRLKCLKYTIASTGWKEGNDRVGVGKTHRHSEGDRQMSRSAKVDAYLAKVKPFALPIMEHLRDLVHKGCPEVEETIKWSRPFFVYKAAILGNMSAFNEHCSFGFWGEEIGAVLREAGVLGEEGMGSLGRITSLKDLPSDKKMVGWIRQAAGFVDRGEYTSPIAARSKVVKVVKGALEKRLQRCVQR